MLSPSALKLKDEENVAAKSDERKAPNAFSGMIHRTTVAQLRNIDAFAVPDAACRCVRKGSSVVCTEVETAAQICMEDEGVPGTTETLKIHDSPFLGMPDGSLWFDDRILANLSLNHVSSLKSIQVSNTSLSFIHLCGEDGNLLSCSSFSSLDTLDLRDNSLKVLEQLELPALQTLRLSGKST